MSSDFEKDKAAAALPPFSSLIKKSFFIFEAKRCGRLFSRALKYCSNFAKSHSARYFASWNGDGSGHFSSWWPKVRQILFLDPYHDGSP